MPYACISFWYIAMAGCDIGIAIGCVDGDPGNDVGSPKGEKGTVLEAPPGELTSCAGHGIPTGAERTRDILGGPCGVPGSKGPSGGGGGAAAVPGGTGA